jgi:hypothetical protein
MLFHERFDTDRLPDMTQSGGILMDTTALSLYWLRFGPAPGFALRLCSGPKGIVFNLPTVEMILLYPLVLCAARWLLPTRDTEVLGGQTSLGTRLAPVACYESDVYGVNLPIMVQIIGRVI